MRWIFGKLIRLLVLLIVLCVILLVPVGYNELACTKPASDDGYASLITDPEWQRAESRTLTTYPEWHIVHAYDDYAQVIRTGDPHDFNFTRAITGFWQALCPLTERSAEMGGIPNHSKITIYTIGVSFTAELAFKALYEETIGRLITLIRGPERAPLDDLSAEQATEYARFLQQVPWYRWDFTSDAEALTAANSGTPRDMERALALGLEYRAKSAYAGLIEQGVAELGADALRIRSLVTGISAANLSEIGGVTVIEERAEGIVIETPRYRAFTRILADLADAGGDMVEIAGNDEILFTATSSTPEAPAALNSFQRQGYGDYRHLILTPVPDLLENLRGAGGLTLEHVHDY